MFASRLTSSGQYFVPAPYHCHYQQQQQQQQKYWDTMASAWNPRYATGHDRKLFSVDAILDHSDTWRADHESISRLETSDLSGELRLQFYINNLCLHNCMSFIFSFYACIYSRCN